MSNDEDFDYCSDLVRRRDEDRWLAAHYAPPQERSALCTLYALHLEIAHVPTLVSEAPLGEIRLQWWREALQEIDEGRPRPHPVTQAAHALRVTDAQAHKAFVDAIDARARLLYGDPFVSVDDLAAFLRRAEAFLAPLVARRLVATLSEAEETAVREAALANALARRGAAIAPSLADDIAARAEDLHRQAAPALRALPAAAMPAFAHFALTRSYLRRRRALSPVGRRLRLFAAVASGLI